MKTTTSKIGKRRAAAKSKTVSSETYQRRRREIAAAAARVFNEKGFRGTTISAVAEALQIDRASIYYYISSKDELFDDVIREASEENVLRAQRIQKSDLSASEKLRTLIRELMDSYAETYPLLYIFIRVDLKHVPDKRSAWAKQMKKIGRQYDDAVTSIIEEGYRDGSFRDLGPARLVAFGIIGMLNWTNRWFDPENSKASAEDLGNMYAELVTSGLEHAKAPARKKNRPVAAKRQRAEGK
ncbi:TetR/AcrR family transcriptional regulator [Luminiphilus syltensis]|uniref:TetR/AcrR family transcriptional regulator n=1 Tax=Luminiphilus syltensis TaxID=1341119 RepID=UPI0002E43267|nr:TetR/AcrR family transcriptional regulator [Luminiphilus syltensis]